MYEAQKLSHPYFEWKFDELLRRFDYTSFEDNSAICWQHILLYYRRGYSTADYGLQCVATKNWLASQKAWNFVVIVRMNLEKEIPKAWNNFSEEEKNDK